MFANLAVCNDDFENLGFNKAKEDFFVSKIKRKSNPKGGVLYLVFSS
jgi:hypothetical protein